MVCGLDPLEAHPLKKQRASFLVQVQCGDETA